MKYTLVITMVLAIATWNPARAQYPVNEGTNDFSTIDATIKALYSSISGEKGEPRDWETFDKLFVDDARLIVSGKNSEGTQSIRAITPQQYKDQSGPWLVENGFIEEEIHRETDRFGSIAQLFSTYTSRHSRGGEIIDRGINSIQLYNDGDRWWVVTIYWTGETDQNPIPEAYGGN